MNNVAFLFADDQIDAPSAPAPRAKWNPAPNKYHYFSRQYRQMAHEALEQDELEDYDFFLKKSREYLRLAQAALAAGPE